MTIFKSQTCSKECANKLVSLKLITYHASLTPAQETAIKQKMYQTKIRLGTTGVGREAWNKGKTGIYSLETIEKIRRATLLQMSEHRIKKTECEKVMESILQELEIKYIYSFVIQHKQYDFLLINYNVIIEYDGDYWHGNLSIDKFSNLSEMQLLNQANDIYKNILAQTFGYFIFRFWENEILNHTEIIKEKIKTIMAIIGENQQPSLE
jgi:very-short-patch-repair endonuclease